jgi:hypothetical protein
VKAFSKRRKFDLDDRLQKNRFYLGAFMKPARGKTHADDRSLYQENNALHAAPVRH